MLLFAIFQHSLDHSVSFFVMLYKISPFIMQFSIFKKLHVFVRLVGVLYSNSLLCPPISFLKVGIQKYLSIYNLHINPSIDLSIYYYIYYSNLTEITWIYYIYAVKKKDKVPSQLSSICQWPHNNTCTWAHDVWLHIAGTNEPKSVQKVNQRV